MSKKRKASARSREIKGRAQKAPAPLKDKTSSITKGINLATALGGLLLTGWSYKQKLAGKR